MHRTYQSVSNDSDVLLLQSVDSRPVTWQEVSAIVRRLRWKPTISNQRGITYLAADRWGQEVRIASTKQLLTMTPAGLWYRLGKLDPYRVAEVKRNIW